MIRRYKPNLIPVLQKILRKFELTSKYKPGVYPIKPNRVLYCANTNGQLYRSADLITRIIQYNNNSAQMIQLLYNTFISNFRVVTTVTEVSIVYSDAFDMYSYMFYHNYCNDKAGSRASVSCYQPGSPDTSNPIFFKYDECLNYCIYMNQRGAMDIKGYLDRQKDINQDATNLCNILKSNYEL